MGSSELTRLQSNSLNGSFGKRSPCFDSLIGSHNCSDNRLRLGGVFLGYIVDYSHRRSAPQSLSDYEYDLTICHVPNMAWTMLSFYACQDEANFKLTPLSGHVHVSALGSYVGT